MKLPLLLGRDVLHAFGIKLTKPVYAKEELIKLNTPYSKEITKCSFYCALGTNSINNPIKRFDICRNDDCANDQPTTKQDIMTSNDLLRLCNPYADQGDDDPMDLFSDEVDDDNVCPNVNDKLSADQSNQVRQLIDDCYLKPLDPNQTNIRCAVLLFATPPLIPRKEYYTRDARWSTSARYHTAE